MYEGEFRMNHWTNGKRWLSFALAMTMLLSLLCMSASANAPSGSLEEAKASLADVTITQTYNTKPAANAVHDYRTDGSDVFVTYAAELRMTDVMAEYLTMRQTQLCKADFNVKMNVELDWLDWTAAGNQLTFTFQSTFLKPVQPAGSTAADYSFKLRNYDKETKYFIYDITATKSWIAANWKNGAVSVPMELIYFHAGDTVCGIESVPASASGAQGMFWNYTAADWVKPITLTLAGLKVRADKAATVTENTATWKTLRASGTVEGGFTYITVDVPSNVGNAASLAANKSYVKTLAFGNDADITEWKSNEVTLLLKRSSASAPVVPSPGGSKEPSDLNITDHFAYVIGYPDGTVRPDGNVTRAEVATIFFRMLKDDAREKYWKTDNRYSDVKSTDWYNNAISTLSNMGIIDGYPDGTFRPNAGITRAEFAKIAVSFFKDNVRETIGDRFSDIHGKWYTEYVNLANELAIVNGYPDGTFRPDNKIIRAESMTIVNNTLRRTPCKGGLLPVSVMITWPDNAASAWYYEAVQEATNSHEYSRTSTTAKEQWTKLLPVRDWAAFERAWSTANSAANPGNVVDGQDGNLNKN